MVKTDSTAIVFVLDKSGSMGVVRDETISGFNEFVQGQKKIPGEVLFSLTLFDTEMDARIVNGPIQTVQPLTHATYAPDGMTALNDAVARTINEVGRRLDALPEHEKPGKVLFVIQTDGQENSSREYTSAQVRDLIKQQTDQWAWQFMFLGADQDAWVGAQKFGIMREATVSYDNNAAGSVLAFAAVGNVAASYRTTGDSVVKTLSSTGNDLRDAKKRPRPTATGK